MHKQIYSEPLRSDKKYLIKGSILNLLGLILRNISPVLVILLARLFPKEVFGAYISIQLFTLTASRLLVMGLDKGLLWYIPQNLKQGRLPHNGLAQVTLLTHLVAFSAWTLASIGLFGGGYNAIVQLKPVIPWFIVLCLFSVVPYMTQHCFAAALEGLRLPEYRLFINQFLTTTLGPICTIVLYYAGIGDMSLAIGFTTANIFGALLLLVLVNRHFPNVRWTETKPLDRNLFDYSWPLGISEAIAGILLRVDLWMVFFLLGPSDAAIYAIMLTLSNGVKGIRQNFDPLIVPIVSKMKDDHKTYNLKEIYSYAINMVTCIQILVAITVLFFSAEIMSLAGKSYTMQPQALSILLVGNLINGFLGLNGQVIMGLGKTHVILYLNVLALTLNIILNFLLIPYMGISGAATATVLAYLIQCLIMYAYQVYLTRQHLYQLHLLVNLLIIVLFGVTTFGFQDVIIGLQIFDKVGGYSLSILGLGIFFIFKRKTFSI